VYRYVVLKLLEPFCQGIISAEPQGLAFIAKYTKLRVHPSQHTVAMLQCAVLKLPSSVFSSTLSFVFWEKIDVKNFYFIVLFICNLWVRCCVQGILETTGPLVIENMWKCVSCLLKSFSFLYSSCELLGSHPSLYEDLIAHNMLSNTIVSFEIIFIIH
jgi:hypothetical protein